ncbi:PIR Superfamily Protein [Plasmodium malariae]|uniref:PIR Superfamily Protein n=1 Tax=Plasmodium malariae TaxID=5858 RepID=A0A1A8WUG5_PLAMA|nr:PIR Superfamily Protein [Plasmodium malariae]
MFLIKISAFILLTWLIKSSNEIYNFSRNLIRRNYRLLAEYKLDKCSNVVVLKEDRPNYTEYKKKYISNNIKGGIRTSDESNKSLNNERRYKQVTGCNKETLDRIYYRFKNKWVNKKDYEISQKQNRRICNINLRKIKFRSYGFAFAIFSLFFSFGIGFPILQALELLGPLEKNILGIVGYLIDPTSIKDYISLIFFGVLIIILAITIMITIPKILINNEKYEKIKLMDIQMNNM